MSYIAAALIMGGAGVAASTIGKRGDPSPLKTPAQTRAEAFIEQLYQQPAPDYPVEPVAGLSELEKMAGEKTKAYAGTEPEGMDYLRKILAEGEDITQIPEYKALLSKVYEQGNLMTNRLGRSLQTRGAATSSTGRNVLGRSVEDVQTSALSALAPYAAQERGRKVTAAESLANLGESATLNRLNALSTQGALERNLEQLRQSAEYQKTMKELNYPIEVQAKLAMGILETPVEWTQEPSILEQIAPLLGVGAQALGSYYGAKSGATTGVDLASMGYQD